MLQINFLVVILFIVSIIMHLCQGSPTYSLWQKHFHIGYENDFAIDFLKT